MDISYVANSRGIKYLAGLVALLGINATNLGTNFVPTSKMLNPRAVYAQQLAYDEQRAREIVNELERLTVEPAAKGRARTNEIFRVDDKALELIESFALELKRKRGKKGRVNQEDRCSAVNTLYADAQKKYGSNFNQTVEDREGISYLYSAHMSCEWAKQYLRR